MLLNLFQNVSEEITNYFNNLKNEIKIYIIKCSIKERITQAIKLLVFIIKCQINMTEKIYSCLHIINEAHQNYLNNKELLHQNSKYLTEKDYDDLLKIINVNRIINNLLKEFKEITEEEFNLNEKELLNEIENKKPFVNESTIKLNDDLFKIEKEFLSCKKENNYYKFIEFILNNYNYEPLNKEEINKYLLDYSSKNKGDLIDNLKLIYSHQNTQNNYDVNQKKIVEKIEGFLNNIKNYLKRIKANN